MFRQKAKLAIGVAAISSAGFGFLGLTPSASAFVFNGSSVEGISADDVGKSFIINFDGNVEGNTVEDLTSTATFTLQSFSETEAIFGIDLENTGSITSRTSALEFETVSTSSDGEPLFEELQTYDSLANGGVSTGEGASTFTATVQLTESVQNFAMSNFGVRYQSIDGVEELGTSGTGRGTPYYEAPPPTSIPEPSTVTALLVSGFALVQQRRRKQMNKNED